MSDEAKTELEPGPRTGQFIEMTQQQNITPNRTFDHKGIRVEEYIMNWINGMKKLFWVRAGCLYKALDEEGELCPITHTDYLPTPDDSTAEDTARRGVQLAFEQHYKL